MKTLRLWTIQTQDAWEAALRRGVLRGDGRRICLARLRPSYRWLMGQMRCRLPNYSGRYPVWAWYAPKPDLRGTGYLPKGTPGVRIEFTVSAASVLLSDFDAWHVVLMQGFLAITEEEDKTWEERWQAAVRTPFARFDALPAELQAELRASWERVFDLAALAGSSMWHAGSASTPHIQAVLEEILLDQVVAVTPFVAR